MSGATAAPAPRPVVVVGAGMAGISTVIWLRSFDIPFRWFAPAGGLGGLLTRIYNPIDDLPPTRYANGASLLDAMCRRLSYGRLAPTPQPVVRISRADATGWQVHLVSGEVIEASTVVLATGTCYRRLGVEGEAEGMGQYVLQSSARHAASVAGRPVAVVGGGDAAFENALNLANVGCPVTLIMRSEPRARRSFQEQVAADPSIDVLPIPTTVERLEPVDDGCRLHLTGGEEATIEVRALFVRIGVDPVLPELSPLPELDDEGFVVVDREQRTSLPGLLAAGDVTDMALRSLATAMGAGARAAKTAQAFTS